MVARCLTDAPGAALSTSESEVAEAGGGTHDGASESALVGRRRQPTGGSSTSRASWSSIVTPGRILALVCLVFVVSALVVASATPWGEANDEPDHVQNVETLVSGHWYRITDSAGFQPHQPPLYYLGLAAWQKALGIPPYVAPIVISSLPNTHLRHDLPSDGSSQRLFVLLRLPSVALGLFTVLLTWAIARRLSRDPWTPVVAAAICAFIPKFVFLSGVINNDNLANTLAALATLLAVVIVSANLSARVQVCAAVALGVLAGLLGLTKVSTLPLLVAFVLAMVLARSGRVVRSLVSFGLAFLATFGWWLILNQTWYGDPFAKKAGEDHLRRLLPGLITNGLSAHRAFVDVPKGIWSTFFYSSGWNQFFWSDRWYIPFWILLAVGLLGLGLFARSDRSVDGRALAVIVCLAVCAMSAVWMVAYEGTVYQARVAFIGLPAIAVLVSLGYEQLRLPVVARFALPLIGVIGVVVAIRHDVLRAFPL
jgi:4-amino-4-deoxy-L-arabinose transferase-like glycosyltransferase